MTNLTIGKYAIIIHDSDDGRNVNPYQVTVIDQELIDYLKNGFTNDMGEWWPPVIRCISEHDSMEEAEACRIAYYEEDMMKW